MDTSFSPSSSTQHQDDNPNSPFAPSSSTQPAAPQPQAQQNNNAPNDPRAHAASPATAPQAFDPKEQLQEHDWAALEDEFARALGECEGREEALFADMAGLMAYFKIWAESMHAHDSERARKRLKTRIVRVQHSESELEEKRKHYIKVVEAFENAMNLLSF